MIKKYNIIKSENKYILNEIEEIDGIESNISRLFDSIYEISDFLFKDKNNLSFSDIFKIFSINEIEFNKSDIIKSFLISNKLLYDCEEEIYIKIKISKGAEYEILSILPKQLSLKKNIKGASLTLKIKKQYIPLYLAIFLKDYGIEDYYFTSKSIFDESKAIPFIDLYNYDGEYYIVKNRDKIIYIAISKKMANIYTDIINSIRKDSSQYFVPNIEIICGFKNLVNYMRIQNPDISMNNLKNIVDFTGEFTESMISQNENDSLIDESNSNYIIKTSEGEYLLKENVNEIYDFILKNKIHTPEIMKINSLRNAISKREVIKLIMSRNEVGNQINFADDIGISIFKDNNLIKIYSILVELALENCSYNPCITVVFDGATKEYDSLFFIDKKSINQYKTEELKILAVKDIDFSFIKNILIEKNLEILMNEEQKFSSLDIAINLTPLYKNIKPNEEVRKIKKIKDIQCIIDVDSSLNANGASCGIVLRDSSNKILGKISRELVAKTSVEAEIRGAMYAIKYAIMEDFSEICLRYDYVGIFEYLVSEASTDIAKEYQNFFKNIINNNNIEVYFKKVKAHSSDEYNELADYLAESLSLNESLLQN